MPFWIPFLQKKCNQDNMQYLCVPFTFQSISAYLIHIVPPRFKRKIEDFVAPAWQKLATPISTVVALVRESHDTSFMSSGAGQLEYFTLYRLTSVQVHMCEHTHVRARAHTHAHTFLLARSLSWHCHANKTTF